MFTVLKVSRFTSSCLCSTCYNCLFGVSFCAVMIYCFSTISYILQILLFCVFIMLYAIVQILLEFVDLFFLWSFLFPILLFIVLSI